MYMIENKESQLFYAAQTSLDLSMMLKNNYPEISDIYLTLSEKIVSLIDTLEKDIEEEYIEEIEDYQSKIRGK